MFSLIFFRSDSVGQAFGHISKIFSVSVLTIPHFPGMATTLITVLLTVVFFIVEWIGKNQDYAIAKLGVNWQKPLKWAMYYCIFFAILFFAGSNNQFIYFQF